MAGQFSLRDPDRRQRAKEAQRRKVERVEDYDPAAPERPPTVAYNDDEKYLAQRRVRGLSDLVFGAPDLLNTVINTGLKDIGYFTGMKPDDVYQFQMPSQAAANLATELTGADIVPPEAVSPDVQRRGANQRALIGMIPTGPEDALTASKAMFLGLASKLANKEALKTAQEMLAKGASREDVLKETGWFKQHGDWKYEIPDDVAAFNEEAFPRDVGMQGFMDDYAREHYGVDSVLKLPPHSEKRSAAMKYGLDQAEARRTKPVSEVIEHPELYSSYDDIGQTRMGPDRNANLGFSGSYKDNEIGISPRNPDKLSTGLHELQHKVQEVEGFAPGGNTMSVFGHSDPIVRKAGQEEMERLLAATPYDEYAKLVGAGWPEATEAQLKASYRDYLKSNRKARSSVYDPANKAAQQTAAERVYRRMAGEVEARNVQARRSMTAEQRRETPPWQTQDIPDERQIVRKRNDVAEAMAAKDPDWFHPVGGGVRHKQPFSTMTSTTEPSGPMLPDVPISPERLQGGFLIPLYGDRTMAGRTLTHVNDQPLPRPQPLQGGGRFMQENPGKLWASEKGRISTMANKVQALEQASGGKPVYGTHVAMGPESGDFAKMMTRPVLDLLDRKAIPAEVAEAFDAEMAAAKGWPGIKTVGDEWLATAPGKQRADFAKIMQKARYQDQPGFPAIAPLRKATTEPELMNVPMLTSGMSVGRFDPGAPIDPLQVHDTYSTNILGQHVGNFGQVPVEVMFPDIMRTRPPGEPLPHTGRTFETKMPVQETNQQWVDNFMRWLEGRRR
jgi:hypothetical protein